MEQTFQNELFQSRIRELRKQKHESQKDVAEALGVTITQISDMEKGRRTTTFEKLFLLCRHFQVSADYLLGLEDTPRFFQEEDTPGAHKS
ncbi:MAG: helix-turn-helix transcriptional regulator [Oscillospiraceae bacterium]|nr:helix-turn-helix transcriptional regulator [Oscillospiraceae bacterium]